MERKVFRSLTVLCQIRVFLYSVEMCQSFRMLYIPNCYVPHFCCSSQGCIEGTYYIEVLNENMDPLITQNFFFPSLQQLRSNLREMEKLCGRVRSADVEDLEKLVQPIRDRASTAIQEFLQIHSDAINRPCLHETIGTASDKLHSMCFLVCLSFMKLIKM